MSRRHAGASVVAPVLLVGALTLGACGTTYVDSSVTTPSSIAATTLPAVAADSPIPVLFTELDTLMRRLDEQIVEADGDQAAFARIEQIWAVAEAQIRERDADDLFPFEQAITLARSGVERRRPADASKGYKLLVTAITQYDVAA